MKKHKKQIRDILLAFFVIVAVVSGIKILQILSEDYKQEEKFKQMQNRIEVSTYTDVDSNMESMAETEMQTDNESEKESTVIQDLLKENAEMYGWIEIEGTTLSYPVMYTPDEPEFYLNHNFDKDESRFGVPFIDGENNLKTDMHIVIYGHHIKGGKMFGMLEAYKKQEFWKEHPVIRLTNSNETSEYQIFAVYKTTADEGGFDYVSFREGKTDNEYDDFISKCKELSFYETGITPEYGTELISLSTCEYSQENGRLVVVAVKIS